MKSHCPISLFFTGTKQAGHSSNRPDQKEKVVFDRASWTILQLKAFSSYNLGARLRLFVHMVHTGEAGGILGQTIIGLAVLAV
jgi:uncharacterized iron-regulated membrane protein